MFRSLIFYILGLCCVGILSANAQEEDKSTSSLVATIVEERPSAVEELRRKTYKIRNDSLAITQLISKSNLANYQLGKAYGYNMMGVYLRDRSNYSEAIEYHNRSITLAQEINSVELSVNASNMLGVVYRRIDQVRSALDYHQQALTMAEAVQKKSDFMVKNIAISLNSMGNVYLTLRQYDLAEEQFQQAISYEERLGSKLGLAINYANLGIAQEERGLLDYALTNYQKSLSYNEEIDSDLGRMICHNQIGQVYLKQGKIREGYALIEPTLAVAEQIGDDFYISMANINAGWALTELGHLDQAESLLRKGLDVSKQKKLQGAIAESYNRLAILKEKQGNYRQALFYQRLSQQEEEQILNETNQQYMSDLFVKYDTEKKANKIKLLEKENEIVNIQLDQSNKNLLFAGILLALVLISGLLLFTFFRLKNEKKMLQAEQKLLRSQMNPHFIFNSLLSIKLYMLNNDIQSAVEYLNQFSKLIRTILSNSLEKEISLAEELETMRLYVNIENMRFFNEIDYNVDIDPSIDLEAIQIPSLTLQPFIENAIWHGLLAKEGSKSLSLNVRRKGYEFIEIEIIDNGIGRKKTMEIESEKHNTQKKSIGLKITRQRLENFSRNFVNMHSLNIIDLYDDHKNPLGTKVLLSLPVK